MIITAIQRGSYVHVYGEGNRMLFSEFGELMGYTSNSVSIKCNGWIHTYDSNHRMIATNPAK